MENEVPTTHSPAPTPPAPQVNTPVSPAVQPLGVVAKGPRSYLVVMILSIFALGSGLGRAYRGEKIGWIRFWIYVGCVVLSPIPILNILAGIGLIVLMIWGAIDVFKLYKVRTDADGGALVTSPRDEQFAKGFYIFFLVSLILSGLAIIFAIAFGSVLLSSLLNNPNMQRVNNGNSTYDSSYNLRDLNTYDR